MQLDEKKRRWKKCVSPLLWRPVAVLENNTSFFYAQQRQEYFQQSFTDKYSRRLTLELLRQLTGFTILF